MDKNCNMRTGFQNKSLWMRAAKSFSALLAVLAVVTLTGCGEPGAPGLGSVVVNGGADIEVPIDGVTPMGFTCDMTLVRKLVPIIITKEDADLGNIEFGADTILDLQEQAPNVEPVTNALVTIGDIRDDLVIQHSTQSNAPFFTDPSLVLGTATGIATVRTGDDGVSYMYISIDALNGTDGIDVDFSSVPPGVSFSRSVSLTPASPSGSGIVVTLNFSCAEGT